MQVLVTALDLDLEGRRIVDGASLRADPGEIVGLVGPNGSGKSTLLRSVYRALRPAGGAVRVGADDVWSLSARDSALRTAVLAQENHSEFDFTVGEVVAMGRTPHKRLFDRESAADRDVVADALAKVRMTAFATRVFGTLSGGEKQRVLLARALAQGSSVLVLDEPTNHLDIAAQLELLELVRGLGVTTVAAIHELNLAAAYCDRVYLLAQGRVVADGTPEQVLTPALLRTVFGVHAHAGVHPATGRLHLAFAPAPAAGPAPQTPCAAGDGTPTDPQVDTERTPT
ncbi:MAG: ABC transporter ATP-binding protein [Actinobacteria bacterium]|nr:ABC transporter ATP-binding protein [Actinomycetota bacterium]